ncbi:electron transport complex subunit RsxC [Ectopseudomonas alcaliphila]|uniref:Ion-translocating oxidoreductase complex subunit C n=2 Tax=Ectopseudomonas alcaliphila TaxID=101564 RepID=A0A1G6V5C2_9GAMM|nr:electron transport complex subunit RsxC [Pseudomonas alcaliphila]MDX5991689.1 electron transport complex subunit RsxC [Pseudomonas alcaliphila]SDD48075.1 electron transport complex protein RnfC [Pseudomonas alcaliphila]
MSAQERIWDIPGGIHPAERKDLSNRTPIQQAPLPQRLTLPLGQHIGAVAEPCVVVGQRVRKGEKIAEANGFVSAPLHAPTSGTVSFIGPQPYPHVSGMLAPAIVIDSDGLDEWVELTPHADYRHMESAELLALIREAGISGLGGAGFPTAVKLTARPTQKIHTLIINGTECEPYITADDLLMRERAGELVSGIDILVQLIQPDQVLIGIEDNKPEAIAAVRAACVGRDYQVRVFPTKYPSGGEKQLIQILTGVEVPSGGLPADIGILCQNVGTCTAIHDAVVLGRPLISRITTLTGEALARPGNVEARLGTPVAELLEFAGLDQAKLNRLIMGGPMMGFTLPSLDVPLVKTANCLLASTAAELPPPPPAMPCIRCGECAEACPASLLPQQLHFFALGQEHEQLKAHNLFDCIECGACAYVCPSSIPLVQYYRAAKAEIRELEQKQLKAEHSKQRFEQRQERLRRAEEQKEAERKARAEKAARAKAAQAEAPAVAAAAPADEALKKLKIEASMAQVALKKAEKQLAAHNTSELQAQVNELRAAAEAAQKALADAQATAPTPAPKPAGDEALKKAKIEAAMLKAQLRKLEKIETPDDEQQAEIAHVRQQLEAAEKALVDLESQAPAPAAKPSGDDALKKAKIEAAMLKAQLRKLEKIETPDDDQQAEIARVRQQLEAAEKTLADLENQAPAPAAKPAGDEALKKAKIEAAMLKAQLRKLEKIETPDDDQQAEIARVRQQLEAAEKTLADLENQAPAPAAKPAGDEALKKAKIELAMKRAELKKAEKAGNDEAALQPLRDALAAAEQALHAAEAASNKPAPELVRTERPGVDAELKALKTEVAFARADLRKLERDDNTASETLELARSRLAEAERKLAEYQP